MYNNASKRDHLRDKEDFKKNVRPCTIIHKDTIIYETQKILRKLYVHVQFCIKTESSIKQRKF